jgi:hypothetical protein
VPALAEKCTTSTGSLYGDCDGCSLFGPCLALRKKSGMAGFSEFQQCRTSSPSCDCIDFLELTWHRDLWKFFDYPTEEFKPAEHRRILVPCTRQELSVFFTEVFRSAVRHRWCSSTINIPPIFPPSGTLLTCYTWIPVPFIKLLLMWNYSRFRSLRRLQRVCIYLKKDIVIARFVFCLWYTWGSEPNYI